MPICGIRLGMEDKNKGKKIYGWVSNTVAGQALPLIWLEAACWAVPEDKAEANKVADIDAAGR